MVDILENAQNVCIAWRKICKDPAMWRVINMNDISSSGAKLSPLRMCKHAVDRSQSKLVEITFVYAELLYVADRSSQLRRIEMASGLFSVSLSADAMMKFLLLEELNLYSIKISKEEIETVGRYCPMLKTLKVNRRASRFRLIDTIDEGSLISFNKMAIAVGQNLLELRHLELIGNNMTNIGLRVILDNCHHLETLDLRECFYIDLKGDLGKQWSKQIKDLKLPYDYPYVYGSYGNSSDEDTYEDIYDSEDNNDGYDSEITFYI